MCFCLFGMLHLASDEFCFRDILSKLQFSSPFAEQVHITSARINDKLTTSYKACPQRSLRKHGTNLIGKRT